MFKQWLSNVQEQLPQLREQLNEQIHQINQTVTPWVTNLLNSGEEVQVGQHRLRILSKLGEGGYSIVYLAEEAPLDTSILARVAPQDEPRRRYALKKILASDAEHLAAAEKEIAVMRRLPPHPSLLPLLDSQIVNAVGQGSSAGHIVYMLFPLMNTNVWDFVQNRLKQNSPLAISEAVHIFRQLCSALHAMHTLPSDPIAHRDVKPHNILLAPQIPPEWPIRPRQIPQDTDKDTDKDSAHLVAAPSKQLSRGREGEWGPAGHPASVAALMDFGSAAPSIVRVESRSEALTVQEDAERHTTAPYRAPELWDVPSSCVVDASVDIWAAGCVLYYLLVGETPFERTANEAGGSLMLAIVNGQYSWPTLAKERYPPTLLELADSCLRSDPAARPTAAQLLEQIDARRKKAQTPEINLLS